MTRPCADGRQTGFDAIEAATIGGGDGARARILAELAGLIDWPAVDASARSIWPDPEVGRPRFPAAVLARLLIVADLFRLGDAAAVDTARDSLAVQRFIHATTWHARAAIPERRTLGEFRRAAEAAGWRTLVDNAVHARLAGAGLRLTPGKIQEPRLRRSIGD